VIRYLVDLTDETLELNEPGVRIVEVQTEAHVFSVLPDPTGLYDLNIALILAALHRQARDERLVTL
jgi:hypothetical protein